jgi:hypothetical protein
MKQDGGVEMECPPLKALLHIMATGEYQGWTKDSPQFRKLFTCEHDLLRRRGWREVRS